MVKLCASRTAIVTGAGGGLGKCYAKALAEAGANVVVNDINPETAGATVREIIEHGGSASPDHSDITDHVEAGKIFMGVVLRLITPILPTMLKPERSLVMRWRSTET